MATGGCVVNDDGEILDEKARLQNVFEAIEIQQSKIDDLDAELASVQEAELTSEQEALLTSVQEVEDHQADMDYFTMKASEEKIKIEQKYNNLRKPHIEKRDELIGKIPNFWLLLLGTSPLTADIINDEEEQCLNYLTKLEVEVFEDIKSGYRLKFYFKENPYFENDVIVKELHFGLSEFSQSTTINWKDNMDLLKLHQERQERKEQSRKRKSPEWEPTTFFEWFTHNGDPRADSIALCIKGMWRNPLRDFPRQVLFQHATDMEVENNERETEPVTKEME